MASDVVTSQCESVSLSHTLVAELEEMRLGCRHLKTHGVISGSGAACCLQKLRPVGGKDSRSIQKAGILGAQGTPVQGPSLQSPNGPKILWTGKKRENQGKGEVAQPLLVDLKRSHFPVVQGSGQVSGRCCLEQMERLRLACTQPGANRVL